MSIAITNNFEQLFESSNCRFLFFKKLYTVSVYRDWDGNRLVKTVNGKVKRTMSIPRNWTDKLRQDGRKWQVTSVEPAEGIHLTPLVNVTFTDTLTGKTLTKSF